MQNNIHKTHTVTSKLIFLKKILIVLSIMSVIAGTLTGIMTWANIGFSALFYRNWGQSFVMAITIMMPIAMIVVALVGKLINRSFPNLSDLQQNIISGLFMAVFMQSVMATVTTANTIGFNNVIVYQEHWINAIITAFPVGLTFALAMTTYIKPRLVAYIKQ